MISKEKPIDFKPKFHVVSCFVEHDGKILLLHRQDHKPQGGTWAVPAGKVENNESISGCIVREVREEIGIIVPEEKLTFFESLYVKYSDYDFIYHIFHLLLETPVQIDLNTSEHKNFQWLTPRAALKLDLIQDEDFCIKSFYNI
jgi:8-oxo-dGTP pyrophosphatase MutT (NUDIX family)